MWRRRRTWAGATGGRLPNENLHSTCENMYNVGFLWSPRVWNFFKIDFNTYIWIKMINVYLYVKETSILGKSIQKYYNDSNCNENNV